MARAKDTNGQTYLTENEEKVLRMRKGSSEGGEAFLPRKTKDKALLALLLEFERALIAKAANKK